MSHDLEEWCKIWRKTDFLFQKFWEFGEFWTKHSKVSKICTLNGLLLTNAYNVWAKEVQRSYLSWHRRVMQNLKKNWLVVWKMIWEIWKIFTRARKVSKLRLSWNPFVQNRKFMSLKFTEELCVMTMMNDTKIEEELTSHFKIDMRNLTNFDPSTRKSPKFGL